MKKTEQNIQDIVRDSITQYLQLHNVAYSEQLDLHSCSSNNLKQSATLNRIVAWGEVNSTYPFSYNIKRQYTYCIFKTLNGNGTVSIGDSKYILSPGSVYFFSCDKTMNIKIQSSQWSYIVLYLEGPSLPCFFSHFHSLYDYCLPDGMNAQLNRPINNLVSYLKNYNFNEFVTNKLLVDLLTNMVSNYALTQDDSKRCLYLEEAKKIYDEEYAKRIDLESMSIRLGINKFRLCREFKSVYGYSPLQYLNLRRLNAAEDLLLGTDLKIHEISDQVGFENTTHFINLFKRKNKITPAVYRNRPPVL